MLVATFRALDWKGPYPGGKHPFMQKGTRLQRIPNPHEGDIDISLLKRILRQAGISDDDWNGARS